MSADLRLEPLHPARKAVVLLFLCAGAWYLLWRAGSLNPEAPVFSWALYLAEIYGFLGAMAHFYMNWSLTDRRAPAPEPSLSVDVFIPTYNEPVELVRRTVLAAVALRGSHTTWVLDDGDRPEMAAMARELGAEYLARKDNLGAKAGNLNHALARSRGDLPADPRARVRSRHLYPRRRSRNRRDRLHRARRALRRGHDRSRLGSGLHAAGGSSSLRGQTPQALIRGRAFRVLDG